MTVEGQKAMPRSVVSAGADNSKAAIRTDIQGLRAFAVTVVILEHLLSWPAGGFVGVDIFFVISGYLITGILVREQLKTGHVSAVNFYGRRIKRIVPAATLVLLVTGVASAFLVPARAVAIWRDAFWALVFTGNWNMAISGTDYFAQGQLPSPLQHYWSLSVEEQFYFVWPWLLVALFTIATKLRWSAAANRTLCVVALFVLTAASYVWSQLESVADPNFAYFSTLSRTWELGVGALVALLTPALTTVIPRALGPVFSFIGLAGITASVFLLDSSSVFPAPGALGPVFAAALIILGGSISGQSRANRWAVLPIANPVGNYLGKISYSLYLWHFPIIISFLALMPGGTVAYYSVVLATTLVLSILSFHFVEEKVRRSDWLIGSSGTRARDHMSRARPRFRDAKLSGGALGLVAISMVSAAVVVLALTHASDENLAASQSSLSSNAGVQSDTDSQPAVASPRCFGAAFRDPTIDCAQADLKGLGLTPSPDKVSADLLNGCFTVSGASLVTCSFGLPADSAKLRVAVVGDSHAQDLVPALASQAKTRGWLLDSYVGDGCVLTTETKFTKCAARNQIMKDLLAKHYDLVVATNSRFQAASVDGLEQAFREVVASGAAVAVVPDRSPVTEDAVLCPQRVGFDPLVDKCGSPPQLKQRDSLPTAVAAVHGAHLVDISHYFCDPHYCPSVVGGVIVYRDALGHITATYSKTLGPYLAQAVAVAVSPALSRSLVLGQ